VQNSQQVPGKYLCVCTKNLLGRG